MIDLKKERKVFERSLLIWRVHLDFYLQTWEKKSNSYACMTIQWYWEVWLKRAELAQQEIEATKRELEFATKTINNLLEKLEAKHKAYIFLDDCRKEWHKSFIRKCEENKELKAKLAKYESDDVVIMPRNANSDMLNNGWSAIGYDSIEEDDISNVYKAMIEAGEIK